MSNYRPCQSWRESRPSHPAISSQTTESQFQSYNIQYHCITTLRGHNSYVSSLAIAGKFLLSGSSDREIRSWRRNPLSCNLDDHDNLSNNVVSIRKGAVKSLLVLSDKLFSAHQDHKIRVWRIESHEDDHQKCARVATLPTLGDRAFKLLIPKNHVQIRRHKTSTWVHHVDTVSALALSADEALLYSVSWDRTLKIWRASDFKCLESIEKAHDDAINAVASSDDGSIYTGSADKKIKVWKKIPGQNKHYLVDTLKKHNSGINALAMTTDGSVLFSGAFDRAITVWEKDEDGKLRVLSVLKGHTESVLCMTVLSDILFSGSADKTIRIWKRLQGSYSCLTILEGHQGPVKCLAGAIDSSNSSESASSSSYLIYSGSLDCDIKEWQVHIPNI